MSKHINPRHPITLSTYVQSCKDRLDADGALVLAGFFSEESVASVAAEALTQIDNVFYAGSTHNVYLTDPDSRYAADHPFNRQVVSSKGLIADDQITASSPLREVYNDPEFRAFLAGVLGIDELHPYDDPLSSINVHFASAGRELGWHFDNSSFAVTMLLQAPEVGGVFEYVPSVRDSSVGDMAFDRVADVLDGQQAVRTLDFDPGALVLFRGRNALHRVTPVEGLVTRLLVVFAYNDQPGVRLSDSALTTFYGRTT